MKDKYSWNGNSLGINVKTGKKTPKQQKPTTITKMRGKPALNRQEEWEDPKK